MITAEVIANAGISIDSDDLTALNIVDAALDYIAENSTIKVDKSDLSSLPAAAKIFIVKFSEIINRTGISSESMSGMSQSFESGSTDSLLLDLFNTLLGKYAKSQMHIVQCTRRWDYGR